MPHNPKRVQAVFLQAVNYHDLADRAAILDRECMGDSDLRQRVEALLKAHDQFNDFVNQPPVGTGGRAPRRPTPGDGAQSIDGVRQARRKRRTPCGGILCVAQRSSGHRTVSMK